MAYDEFFTGGQEAALRAFKAADTEADGRLDVAEWSSALVLDNLGATVSLCKQRGPLADAALDAEELELVSGSLGVVN